MSGKCKEVYELIKEEELTDIKSRGYLLRHIKSGARIAVIGNDDNNKVFSVGFRTPPKDSTGVAHITEHSVLCGSKKYPLKDPFVELVKGSLNTFLNAMTYSDKTVYPVASCNDKDFANLMNVYMDAVFYPNSDTVKEIFMQEGWHYEMEDMDSPLTINGVVYNEMRGVFSSPEQILARMIQSSLFDDNTYAFESGGDPDNIPDLTYEDFVAFHKRYYHPSNSYIYLYGDMDIEERLMWMDRYYLRFFDKIEVDSEIPIQKPFDETRYIDAEYSAQKDDDKAYYGYNFVVGTSLDVELMLAMDILTAALVNTQGSPIEKAIKEAGIAEDVSASLDVDLMQPVLSISVRQADAKKRDEFVKVIRETLEQVCREGVDKKTLKAAITRSEFHYREADFGRYPKGLMFGLQSFVTWLYDDNRPYDSVKLNAVFEKVKGCIGTDYFEKLIKEYLLDNTHSSVVSLYPKEGLTAKKDEELAAKLKEYRDSLSKDELAAIVESTKHLKEYQEAPETAEALKTIPLLNREDIDKEIRQIYLKKKNINSIPVLHHDIYTNGIAYMCFAYDITEYEEYVQYINLLSSILGSVDTVNYGYLELSNEINLATGGMNTSLSVKPIRDDTDNYRIMLEFDVRTLYSSMERTFELIKEILRGSILSDKKRIKEVLLELRAYYRGSLESAGNMTALERSNAYSSKSAFCWNKINGIAFYRFLSDLCERFDECADDFIRIIETLLYKVFRTDNLLISFTADEEGYNIFTEKSYEFFEAMYPENDEIIPKVLPLYNPVMGQYNEGFMAPGKVQYVARTGNYIKKGYEYSGSLRVLRIILSYGYLWNNIRVKGGAYGAMSGFSRSGNGYLVSYRDPNLAETNRVYEELPEFLENFEADEREMTKYVIGTISDVDAPLTPRATGKAEYNMYMSGADRFDMQKERDEILAVNVEDIRKCADIVRAILSTGDICVVGSKNAIEENKELFGTIEDLL